VAIKRTHIVTVRILNEGESVESDLVNELHALMIGRVVNTTLQNAASVSVSGDFNTVGCNGIVDELQADQYPSEACVIALYLVIIRS